MRGYFYIHFDDSVHKNIEKEYNRLLLQEQYQEKKEQKYRVRTVEFDDILALCPDPDSLPKRDFEVEQKRIHGARIKYLPVALGLLKIEYPELYSLIIEYFYADEKISMAAIGEEYGFTVDKVRYKLKVAKEKLKAYIIMHESKE